MRAQHTLQYNVFLRNATEGQKEPILECLKSLKRKRVPRITAEDQTSISVS